MCARGVFPGWVRRKGEERECSPNIPKTPFFSPGGFGVDFNKRRVGHRTGFSRGWKRGAMGGLTPNYCGVKLPSFGPPPGFTTFMLSGLLCWRELGGGITIFPPRKQLWAGCCPKRSNLTPP
eukprot:FR743239.1.p4 GENE.FR743239.1~~FR743239.1.p4  ORF type:complete len:122 (-),score=33.25 FR743239.1:789-1154(-)